MDESRETDDRPFLTLISWPPDQSRAEVKALLAEAAGLDGPTLSLRLRREPPFLYGQVPAEAAEAAVIALRGAGGDAFAPTLDDLAALGPTWKIRDLRLEGGVLVAQLWRGGTERIRRQQIQFLVRAHLSRVEHVRVQSPLRHHGRQRSMTVGYMLGGVGGMVLAAGAAHLANRDFDVDRELRTSDKLDIHTADGRVFQVDGDKFGYRILGDLRGHCDKTNMDRLCELLSHLAPEEIVDEFFSLWRPPANASKLRLPDMKINNDDPAFAFYSRWTALVYRHVLGAPGPA